MDGLVSKRDRLRPTAEGGAPAGYENGSLDEHSDTAGHVYGVPTRAPPLYAVSSECRSSAAGLTKKSVVAIKPLVGDKWLKEEYRWST